MLAGKGFDPLFGARPLKRTIQTEIENPLATAILSGTIREGDRVAAERGMPSSDGADALLFRKIPVPGGNGG